MSRTPRFGKAGFCKLCRWDHEGELNAKIKAGQNAAECLRWAKDKYDFTFTRQTLYTHKEHLKAPEEKVIEAAGRVRREKVIPKTNREFLEAVRDLAISNALDDPDSVTLEHGLKAASILESSKQKQGDITLILAQVVTGHQPDVLVEATAAPVMIEGTAREVEPVEQ